MRAGNVKRIAPDPPPEQLPIRTVRTGRVSAEQAAARRALMVATATDEFLEHGFAGTSMTVIAKACRVSKGTIYVEFGSKEKLFLEIAADCLRDFCDELARLTEEAMSPEGHGPFRDVIRGAAELIVHYTSDPKMNRIQRMVVAENGHFPAIGEMLEELTQKMLRPLALYLQAQTSDEALSLEQAHQYAFHLQSLSMGGLASLIFAPERLYGPRELWIESVVDIFTYGFGRHLR